MGATWSNWVNLERERVVAVPINVYIYIYTLSHHIHTNYLQISYILHVCLFWKLDIC